jgi:hypothetical protein
MRKKLICFSIFILLIGAIFVPISGKEIKNIKINEEKNIQPLPIPGCLVNNELPKRNPLIYEQKTIIPEKQILTTDNNIINMLLQLDENLLLGFLENLTSFGPRVTTSLACENAGEYIYNQFVSWGLDTKYHYWEDDNLFGNNIEATITGNDPSSDEIYIICAHYDSVPGSPGADDDGSGVAAVMAAAKLMSAYSWKHTVRFIAFSGEEQGLYGSYYYVSKAIENEDNIVAVLNADMIGFAKDDYDANRVKIFEDDYSTWITSFTIDINNQYEDYIGLEVIPSGYSWGSDHYYFWQAGYNAIFYFEYNFNDYYHSPDDTIENMDLNYAKKNSRLILATLAELSIKDTQEAPDIPVRPIGNTNGKAGNEYSYTSSTSDPQNDQISYLFDWGDGTDSGWIGPYNSNDIASASHSWTDKGNYQIKVKAKDNFGHESDWSEPLSISMPRNRGFNLNSMFEYIFFKLYLIKNIIEILSHKNKNIY